MNEENEKIIIELLREILKAMKEANALLSQCAFK